MNTSTATPPACGTSDNREQLLEQLERTLESAWQGEFDAPSVEALELQLRNLHVCLRNHDAAQHLMTGQQIARATPQHADNLRRLLGEHTVILGMLDRLVRAVDALPGLGLEDKEVFFLRGRELIAVLRRHQAEEDRLFFISLWHDTGGES